MNLTPTHLRFRRCRRSLHIDITVVQHDIPRQKPLVADEYEETAHPHTFGSVVPA